MEGGMNDIEHAAIVDTDRDELRDRIGVMRQRLYRVARSADPGARRRGLAWNVQEVVAHVLSVAQRYQAVAEGRDFNRARHPRDLDHINEDEMNAAIAPIADLVHQLQALETVMDEYFDGLTDDSLIYFHCGETVSGISWQINWLLELVFHGDDIARAAGVPWEISQRDSLLTLREAVEVGPAWARSDLDPADEICAALEVPGARPCVIHVHDGGIEMRARRAGDRPDAVLRAPASTMIQMLLHRIGPFTATRRGLRIVGGRRPWKALKLQSCFETA
jgi:Mycothiol maleylpyruvate isomerase N-terminal domain